MVIPNRRRRIRAWVIGLLVLVVAGVLSQRESLLRAAGWSLVIRSPIELADVIVVTADSNGEGTLEASDLVIGGTASTVAVFEDPPDPVVDIEFLRRGIPYEDAAAKSIRQLKALGVKNVLVIARSVTGSVDEGRVLPAWCDQHDFRSIVVVSTSDHSRRLQRILSRAFRGHRTRVTVKPSRYSNFDPNRWWTSRNGVRTEIIEMQKLFLDLILHPLS